MKSYELNKLIICEGPTDLEFLASSLELLGYRRISNVDKGKFKEVKLKKKKTVKIVSVGGIGNILSYVSVVVQDLLNQQKISKKDVIIVVDELDFKEEKNKFQDLSFTIIKIPVNLDWFLACKLKKFGKFKELISFWEGFWGNKIEDMKSRDIKELLYYLHGLVLKSIKPKERCLKSLVKTLVKELGKNNIEVILEELGILKYL